MSSLRADSRYVVEGRHETGLYIFGALVVYFSVKFYDQNQLVPCYLNTIPNERENFLTLSLCRYFILLSKVQPFDT